MRRFFHLTLILLIPVALLACSGPDTKSDEPPRKTNRMSAQEHFLVANTQLDAGDYKGAIKEYKIAAKRHKRRWDIPMNMAIAYSRSGQFSEALGAIEVAFQNGGDKEAICYFNLGNIYQERGMYGEAIDAYRAGIAIDPKAEDTDMLINLAAAYLFLYSYPEARETYEHVRKIAPDDPRPVHGLALILQAQNKYAESLQMYEQALMVDPNFSMSYLNKSWVLAALDRYPEAISSLETFLKKDPTSPYVRRANGLLNLYRKRAEEGK